MYVYVYRDFLMDLTSFSFLKCNFLYFSTEKETL